MTKNQAQQKRKQISFIQSCSQAFLMCFLKKKLPTKKIISLSKINRSRNCRDLTGTPTPPLGGTLVHPSGAGNRRGPRRPTFLRSNRIACECLLEGVLLFGDHSCESTLGNGNCAEEGVHGLFLFSSVQCLFETLFLQQNKCQNNAAKIECVSPLKIQLRSRWKNTGHSFCFS